MSVTVKRRKRRDVWTSSKIVRYIFPKHVARALYLVRDVGGSYMFNYNKGFMFMNKKQFDKLIEEHIRMAIVKQ